MSQMNLKNAKPRSLKDLVLGQPDERVERYKQKNKSQEKELQQLKADNATLRNRLGSFQYQERIREEARKFRIKNVDEATRTVLLLNSDGLKAVRFSAHEFDVPGAANISGGNDYKFEKRGDTDAVRASFQLGQPASSEKVRYEFIVSEFNQQRINIGKRVASKLFLDSVSVEAASSDGWFIVYFECSPLGKPWPTS